MKIAQYLEIILPAVKILSWTGLIFSSSRIKPAPVPVFPPRQPARDTQFPVLVGNLGNLGNLGNVAWTQNLSLIRQP